MSDENSASDSVAINEVQLLLSESRTALSIMRTGIAILVLPLSVFSLLVATSRYYEVSNVLQFLVPLAVLCALLLLTGIYLIFHAILRLRRYDRLIHKVKLEHSAISGLLDSTW